MDFCEDSFPILAFSESAHARDEIRKKLEGLQLEMLCAEEFNSALVAEAEQLREQLLKSREHEEECEREIAHLDALIEERIAENESASHELQLERHRVKKEGVEAARYANLESEHLQVVGQHTARWNALERDLGVQTQKWNDAKMNVEKLEARCSNLKRLLDLVDIKNNELSTKVKELREFHDKIAEQLHHSLLTSADGSSKQLVSLRSHESVLNLCDKTRKWLEITAADTTSVFLTGDFFDWGFRKMCEKSNENPDRCGVWLNLPTGRWEFRFVVDGVWTTSSHHATSTNEHGSLNNYIIIE